MTPTPPPYPFSTTSSLSSGKVEFSYPRNFELESENCHAVRLAYIQDDRCRVWVIAKVFTRANFHVQRALSSRMTNVAGDGVWFGAGGVKVLRCRYARAYGVRKGRYGFRPPLPLRDERTGFERSVGACALFRRGEAATPETQLRLSVLLQSPGFGGS